MSTTTAFATHDRHRASHVLGYRCRACGHVTEPAPGRTNDPYAPLESRCAGCGQSIPGPRGHVGLAQVERHFEPLIWWDELAA